MRNLVGIVALSFVISAGHATAETAAAPAPAKCHVAEINPVTNHPHCIDPLGAPVDPMPSAKPCQVKDSTGGWAMSNRCATPAPSK